MTKNPYEIEFHTDFFISDQILSEDLIGDDRRRRCRGKCGREVPSVVNAHDCVCLLQHRRADAALFAADDQEYGLAQIRFV